MREGEKEMEDGRTSVARRFVHEEERDRETYLPVDRPSRALSLLR
jgi:hypothetical protein